jgi:colicin import membrane protein
MEPRPEIPSPEDAELAAAVARLEAARKAKTAVDAERAKAQELFEARRKQQEIEAHWARKRAEEAAAKEAERQRQEAERRALEENLRKQEEADAVRRAHEAAIQKLSDEACMLEREVKLAEVDAMRDPAIIISEQEVVTIHSPSHPLSRVLGAKGAETTNEIDSITQALQQAKRDAEQEKNNGTR